MNLNRKMNNKWQSFILGILSGLILSGIIILISNSKNPQNFNVGSFLKPKRSSTLPSREFPPTTQVPVKSFNESAYPSLELTGKIELNSASLEDLSTLPGIGDAKGKNIIDFRNKYGNFVSVTELLYVPGIGESIFAQIKDLVYISSSKE